MYCEPISNYELWQAVESLKINKSCGPDGISARLDKENVSVLLEPLNYIYNLSLLHGVVPEKLKIAKVIPLFKKGDAQLSSNYRPISLLSVFGQIFKNKYICAFIPSSVNLMFYTSISLVFAKIILQR